MNVEQGIKKFRENWPLASGITIVLGLVLVLFPGLIARLAGYLLGAAAIAFGVYSLTCYFKQQRLMPEFFRAELLGGFLAVALGLYIILHVDTVVSLLPFLAGAALLANGVVSLQRTLTARRSGYKGWEVLLVMTIVTLVFGLLLMVNPFKAIETIVIIIGIALLYEGLSDVVAMLMTGKKIDLWKKHS